MISTGTDDLYRLSRERADSLEAELRRLRDVLSDLVDYADRHRITYVDHDHHCYEEWVLLHDEVRLLLGEENPRWLTRWPRRQP